MCLHPQEMCGVDYWGREDWAWSIDGPEHYAGTTWTWTAAVSWCVLWLRYEKLPYHKGSCLNPCSIPHHLWCCLGRYRTFRKWGLVGGLGSYRGPWGFVAWSHFLFTFRSLSVTLLPCLLPCLFRQDGLYLSKTVSQKQTKPFLPWVALVRLFLS